MKKLMICILLSGVLYSCDTPKEFKGYISEDSFPVHTWNELPEEKIGDTTYQPYALQSLVFVVTAEEGVIIASYKNYSPWDGMALVEYKRENPMCVGQKVYVKGRYDESGTPIILEAALRESDLTE